MRLLELTKLGNGKHGSHRVSTFFLTFPWQKPRLPRSERPRLKVTTLTGIKSILRGVAAPLLARKRRRRRGGTARIIFPARDRKCFLRTAEEKGEGCLSGRGG